MFRACRKPLSPKGTKARGAGPAFVPGDLLPVRDPAVVQAITPTADDFMWWGPSISRGLSACGTGPSGNQRRNHARTTNTRAISAPVAAHFGNCVVHGDDVLGRHVGEDVVDLLEDEAAARLPNGYQ